MKNFVFLLVDFVACDCLLKILLIFAYIVIPQKIMALRNIISCGHFLE